MYAIYGGLEKAAWFISKHSLNLYAWASTRRVEAMYHKYWSVLK